MDEHTRLSRNASVGVHGYLLVYSATSRLSFDKVARSELGFRRRRRIYLMKVVNDEEEDDEGIITMKASYDYVVGDMAQ